MWNYSSIISEAKGDIKERQINSKEVVGQAKCPKESDPLSQICGIGRLLYREEEKGISDWGNS